MVKVKSLIFNINLNHLIDTNFKATFIFLNQDWVFSKRKNNQYLKCC